MVGLKIRMPESLRAKIEEAAKRNGRSMNAEMVACLERLADGLDEATLAGIDADVARYRQRLIYRAMRAAAR